MALFIGAAAFVKKIFGGGKKQEEQLLSGGLGVSPSSY